jgi:CheY-like chemotaxis protein
VVLWVDDLPGNNVWERRALEAYGMRFRLATSTAEAEELLRTGDFAAIISDMSRPGDRRAGYTLLEQVRAGGTQTPYFIYTASRSASRIRDALRRGAQGLTNDPDELVAMVVAAVR